MKADYVHKDSKTTNDEICSYKIKVPLINQDELQRIDNYYNEIVDEFAKQFVKEKDMIITQRVMMNLRKENQKYKEVIEKVSTRLEYYLIGNLKYESSQKEFVKLLDILKEVE